MGLLIESESLAIVTIFLLCLSLLIVSLRCWVRISIKGFGLDDWLMVIGLVRASDIFTGGQHEGNANSHFHIYRYSTLGPVLQSSLALTMVLELAIYI